MTWIERIIFLLMTILFKIALLSAKVEIVLKHF